VRRRVRVFRRGMVPAPRLGLGHAHGLHGRHLVLGAVGRPVGVVGGDDVGAGFELERDAARPLDRSREPQPAAGQCVQRLFAIPGVDDRADARDAASGLARALGDEALVTRERALDLVHALTPARVGELLFLHNASIASSIFGRPLGRLDVGEDADFVVLEPTRQLLDPEARVLRVVSQGRTVYENGEVLDVDLDELHAEADAEAKRLAKRIAAL